MYILGRTQMIPAASYEEAIARIMKKGFDGVELDIYDVNFQARKEFFEEGFAEKIKECMKKNGVKAYSIGAHMDLRKMKINFVRWRKRFQLRQQRGLTQLSSMEQSGVKEKLLKSSGRGR